MPLLRDNIKGDNPILVSVAAYLPGVNRLTIFPTSRATLGLANLYHGMASNFFDKLYE